MGVFAFEVEVLGSLGQCRLGDALMEIDRGGGLVSCAGGERAPWF